MAPTHRTRVFSCFTPKSGSWLVMPPNYNSVHKYTDQRIAADAARPVSVSGIVAISRFLAIVSLFADFYLGRDFPVPAVGLQVVAAYPVGHIS